MRMKGVLCLAANGACLKLSIAWATMYCTNRDDYMITENITEAGVSSYGQYMYISGHERIVYDES